MKKMKPSLIGLIQTAGVIVYCALISGMFLFMEKAAIKPPGFLGVVLMLSLLVFSAAVTGSLIFGYSAYLVLNQKVKEALSVLAYTFLYCLAALIIIFLIVFVFGV